MKPIIHSRKHIVQQTFTAVGTGTEVSEIIALAIEGAPSVPNNVQEGASIKAIYVELWVLGSTQDAFFTIILAKYPGGVNDATISEMAALHDWDNKKNIFYTTQGLAPNESGANPVPIIRQWIPIPKGKQRMGLGDSWKLQIASRGAGDINYCGHDTFKEYT